MAGRFCWMAKTLPIPPGKAPDTYRVPELCAIPAYDGGGAMRVPRGAGLLLRQRGNARQAGRRCERLRPDRAGRQCGGIADPAERVAPTRQKLVTPVSYTHLRAHETRHDIVCRLL